jgi:hypothetical protein
VYCSKKYKYIYEEQEGKVNKQFLIMTLCKRCKDDYNNTGGYYIRRTYSENEKNGKEKCTKCPNKFGWEYEIKMKENRGNRK